MTHQSEYRKAETTGNHIRSCLLHHPCDVLYGISYLVEQRNDHVTSFGSQNLDRNNTLYYVLKLSKSCVMKTVSEKLGLLEWQSEKLRKSSPQKEKETNKMDT